RVLFRSAAGNDIVKRLAQGADYTNAARAMMMAVGCIQAQRCHTNRCPVGVTTQDPRRYRALDVGDKSQRVANYHQATVAEAVKLMAAMGVQDPSESNPAMLRRNITHAKTASYTALYDWPPPGELLADPPESSAADWAAASADTCRPQHTPRQAL